MIKQIFCIGGAPRTGKSTLAKELSRKLQCAYISMDDVIGWLKALRPENINPDLYYDQNMEIEDFYKTYPKPEQVFDGDRKQNKAAEIGIVALIEHFYNWDKVVIEGVGITPEFVSKLKVKYNVTELFLIAKDSEILTKRIYDNGLWDNERSYPDIYKEKERIWTKYYNDWFLKEALKYSFNHIYLDEKSTDTLIAEFYEFI